MKRIGTRPTLGALVGLALSGAGIQAAPLLQQNVLVGRVAVGEVAPGWVGVGFDQVSTGDSTLILVNSVHPGSPAARAGLRQGDRILRVNGTRATFPMIESLGPRIQPGDPYAFDVLRRGDTLGLALVAERHPGSSAVIETRIQSQLDTLRMLIGVTLDSLHVAQRLPPLRVRTEDGEEGTVTLVVSSAPTPRGTGTTATFRTSSEFLPDARHFAEAWSLRDSARTVFELAPERTVASTLDEARGIARDVVRELRRPEPPRGSAGRTPDAVAVWNTTSPLDTYAEGARRVAGAELHRMSPDLGRYMGIDRGLLITEVAPATPAARSGLQPGDVLLAVNGIEVESLDAFRKLLSFPAVASVLTVHRRGESIEVELRR